MNLICKGYDVGNNVKQYQNYRPCQKNNNQTVSPTKPISQGYGEVDGMDVLEWIYRKDVQRNKQVTYPRYVVDICPEKSEPYRTRITAGGDKIDYEGNVTTHTHHSWRQ